MARRSRTLAGIAVAAAAVAALAAIGIAGKIGAGGGTDAAARDAIVASHRGSPALPENTIAAFRGAIDAGADYVETDIVASKDGVLVLRHDRHLSPTTDVEDRAEFADRRRTKRLGADQVTDWWVEDFTAAELRTLRATRRNADPRGDHRIATLGELIAFARRDGAARGRRIGLYLETKHPEAFEELGHDLEDTLADALADAGLDGAERGVYVQSFDRESVRELAGALRVPTIQLVSAARHWDDDLSAPGLRRLRADGIDGVNVVDERLEEDPALIERAHEAGLVVHGWGFEPGEDYDAWIEAGIDGFVTDDVTAALAARRG